jgi:RNA polymerase sigma factor (TIGR02999 family)
MFAEISPVTPSPAEEAGDSQADELFTSLYNELRRLARREIWRNGFRDAVGTTTLVHEAWLHMSGRPELAFEDRARFLAYAARAMRGLVIDRVRAQQALKRGGGVSITSLSTNAAEFLEAPAHLQRISEALDELTTLEPELARVVDLKFFCGFTFAEVATLHGVTERTVQRQWQRARLFLHESVRED